MTPLVKVDRVRSLSSLALRVFRPGTLEAQLFSITVAKFHWKRVVRASPCVSSTSRSLPLANVAVEQLRTSPTSSSGLLLYCNGSFPLVCLLDNRRQQFSGFRSYPSIVGNPMLINFPLSSPVFASVIRIRNHHNSHVPSNHQNHQSRLPPNHQITCIRLNKICAIRTRTQRNPPPPRLCSVVQSDRSKSKSSSTSPPRRWRLVWLPLRLPSSLLRKLEHPPVLLLGKRYVCLPISKVDTCSLSGGAKRGRGGKGGKRAGDRPAKTQEELDKEMTVRRTSSSTWSVPDELCFYKLRTTSTPTPLLKWFDFLMLHDLACVYCHCVSWWLAPLWCFVYYSGTVNQIKLNATVSFLNTAKLYFLHWRCIYLVFTIPTLAVFPGTSFSISITWAATAVRVDVPVWAAIRAFCSCPRATFPMYALTKPRARKGGKNW